MSVYYNENDPKAAAWLRELMWEGHIAMGDVDERSIEDVRPLELAGYTQCHFFAGIGGWSYALRLAGWPDDRPVWTGSCPCQPFSAAGKGGGFADERHLWPAFGHLIRHVRPSIVFGEQVANALDWIDLVSRDLEREGYAFGAAIMGAHSVGAPHIRQRLYWVADSTSEQPHGRGDARRGRRELADDGIVGDTDDARPQGRVEHRNSTDERAIGQASLVSVEYAKGNGRQQRRSESGQWGAIGGCEYLPCTDGRSRPIEPGTIPVGSWGIPSSGTLAGLRQCNRAASRGGIHRGVLRCVNA